MYKRTHNNRKNWNARNVHYIVLLNIPRFARNVNEYNMLHEKYFLGFLAFAFTVAYFLGLHLLINEFS